MGLCALPHDAVGGPMTAVPFRRIAPKAKRMPAHIHLMRLETSPLYVRREAETRDTRLIAKLKAFAYLDGESQPVKWRGEK